MTPQDLDAAVHRATGNEYPDICSGMQRDDNGDCPYCGAYKPGDGKHSIPIPAYSTDPREWAPLLEKILATGKFYLEAHPTHGFHILRKFDDAIIRLAETLGSTVSGAFVNLGGEAGLAKFKEGK